MPQNMLSSIKESDLKKLLDLLSVIDNEDTQLLLRKAAGPHSPISVSELEKMDLTSPNRALSTLYMLEQNKVFSSKLENIDGRTERVFSVTPLGRKVIWPDSA